MSVPVRQVASGTSKEFLYEDSFFTKDGVVPVTTTERVHNGVFKTVSRSAAGTTTVAAPDPDGTIILTDLIISSDKTAGSSVIVRFTDDAQTINVVVGDSVNAPVTLGISFTGHWQGWKDARLEVVTTGNVTVTVSLGYMKSPQALEYAAWDALR